MTLSSPLLPVLSPFWSSWSRLDQKFYPETYSINPVECVENSNKGDPGFFHRVPHYLKEVHITEPDFLVFFQTALVSNFDLQLLEL